MQLKRRVTPRRGKVHNYRDALACPPTLVALSAASMISVIFTTASSCPFVPMHWSETGASR